MGLAGGITEPEAAALLAAARQAAGGAYAPYSRFPVGAALLAESGETVTGVNIENVSYGLTICAERAAVSRAISGGLRRFRAVAVWAANMPHGAVTPCGACRQVLQEFMGGDGVVVMSDPADGRVRQIRMAALLPAAFGFDGDDSCPDTGSSTPGG